MENKKRKTFGRFRLQIGDLSKIWLYYSLYAMCVWYLSAREWAVIQEKYVLAVLCNFFCVSKMENLEMSPAIQNPEIQHMNSTKDVLVWKTAVTALREYIEKYAVRSGVDIEWITVNANFPKQRIRDCYINDQVAQESLEDWRNEEERRRGKKNTTHGRTDNWRTKAIENNTIHNNNNTQSKPTKNKKKPF